MLDVQKISSDPFGCADSKSIVCYYYVCKVQILVVVVFSGTLHFPLPLLSALLLCD